MLNVLETKILEIQLTCLANFLVTFILGLVIFKLNERSAMYVRTQYLILLLVCLCIPIANINLYSIIPVFLMLEFGTILFALLTLKGSVSSFMNRSRRSVCILSIPALVIPFALVQSRSTTTQYTVWYDLFRHSLCNSEFSFWSLSIIYLNLHSLRLLCLLILVVTLAIIYIKLCAHSRTPLNSRATAAYLKLSQSLYFTRKTTVSFF